MFRYESVLHVLFALAISACLSSATQAQTLTAIPSETIPPEAIAKAQDDGLRSEDALVVSQAQDLLVRAGSRAVPGLVAALARKDPLRKRHAAETLGRIGDPAAIPALGALSNDTRGDDALRLAVGEALLALGSKEGVSPLIDLLASGDRTIRLRAFSALSRSTHHVFGYSPLDSTSVRNGAIAEWRAWWERERATFVVPVPVPPLPPETPRTPEVPPSAPVAPTGSAGLRG